MGALEQAVRSGKAIYAGLSNYDASQTGQAAGILRSAGINCLIHQPSYSMFNRWIEGGLLGVLERARAIAGSIRPGLGFKASANDIRAYWRQQHCSNHGKCRRAQPVTVWCG
jgi:hypothetical protein